MFVAEVDGATFVERGFSGVFDLIYVMLYVF